MWRTTFTGACASAPRWVRRATEFGWNRPRVPLQRRDLRLGDGHQDCVRAAPKDPDWLSGKYQRVRFSAPDALVVAGVLGLPTIKTIPDALETVSRLSSSGGGIKAVLVVGAVTGGVLGFWLNWKPNPDCASPELQQVVRDPGFWSRLADAMNRTQPSSS
jgi:hypothetical protein